MLDVIRDGLQNLVSGMGTARDKGSQAEYTTAHQHPHELRTAYEASALIQRAIDMPAEDSTREWREWQADSEQIGDIEAEEKRLGLQVKVFEARRMARLQGGAAIFIGTGAVDTAEPLDPATVSKGGIKYLTLLSRNDMMAGPIALDPRDQNYGKPEYWEMTSLTGGRLRIHPTRVVIFHGIAPLSDLSDAKAFDGWGRSVLPGMLAALKRIDELAANLNSMTYEAKVDVIKIPDLMKNLAARGPAYETEVMNRLRLAATGKGINGSLMLDALEEYQQKSASFGGLADISDRFMQLASTAVGIPMTLFFMTSPGGLNATGASDTRAYYDRVKVEQSVRMQPAMSILDEALIYSALGQRPDDVHYNWRPLWQPTSKERAETANSAASAMKAAVDAGSVPEEVAGRVLSNFFTESGIFPGMEGFWNDFFGGEGTGDAFFMTRPPVERDPPEDEDDEA